MVVIIEMVLGNDVWKTHNLLQAGQIYLIYEVVILMFSFSDALLTHAFKVCTIFFGTKCQYKIKTLNVMTREIVLRKNTEMMFVFVTFLLLRDMKKIVSAHSVNQIKK